MLCWSIGIISLWLGRDGQWGGHCLLEHADAPHTGGGGGEDGGPGGGHHPAPGSTPGTEGLQVSHNIIYDPFYVLVNKCPSLTDYRPKNPTNLSYFLHILKQSCCAAPLLSAQTSTNETNKSL